MTRVVTWSSADSFADLWGLICMAGVTRSWVIREGRHSWGSPSLSPVSLFSLLGLRRVRVWFSDDHG